MLAYTYGGYPLLVFGASRLRPRLPRVADIEPESAHLRVKLDSLLALDYPPDRG